MYAGSTWHNNFEMPVDKTHYGAFTALAEKSEIQIKAIIEELPKRTELTNEEKVNAYYNSTFSEIVLSATILQPPFFDTNGIQQN
ncbi:MAG: putative endopeptidase [Candidatus Azotimanducaceae bacterium]|jgi:putative endopeptidase